MALSPRFLDEIRNRLTLSDIIGRRISVKRAGREFKACCPFHNEKTPSFTINDDKQFYHCFGCGAHGDVIGFVMQHDNLDFINAVEMLSAEAGLQMPKPDPQAAQKAEKEKILYDLMEAATLWMSEQLTKPEYQEIQDYLNSRGLGGQTQANFRLGYAPADGQALRKYLAGHGFHDSMMIEAGVLKESSKGGEPYIFFRDRVMFPVTDRRGRIVAYGGRVLPEHIRPNTNPNFTPPKYINSSDTPLFDKGRMLYGEQHARHAAREGHSIIVTEGYMDVIAAHQAGFKGAVAPMGTALTEEQIANLWGMIPVDEKIPVLCFDGDNAGRQAAARACDRILPLLKAGQSARFAFMPDGEDPDSLIRSGGQLALKNVLQAAMPLFDFLWATHTAGRNFETPEQRAALEKSLYGATARIQDQNVQRFYKELVRNKISETFFQRRSAPGKAISPKNPASALRLKKPAASGAAVIKEKILLATLINHPALYSELEEQIGSLTCTHPRYEALRQSLVTYLCDDPDLDSETLRHHLKNEGYEQEKDDICNESVYVHAVFSRPNGNKPLSGSDEEADKHTITQNWLRIFESMKEQEVNKEIRDGWKQAYENENEEEERKLALLMNSQKGEGDSV